MLTEAVRNRGLASPPWRGSNEEQEVSHSL